MKSERNENRKLSNCEIVSRKRNGSNTPNRNDDRRRGVWKKAWKEVRSWRWNPLLSLSCCRGFSHFQTEGFGYSFFLKKKRVFKQFSNVAQLDVQRGKKCLDENKNEQLGNKQKFRFYLFGLFEILKYISFSLLCRKKMASFRAGCRDPTAQNPPNVSISGIFRYSLFCLFSEKMTESERRKVWLSEIIEKREISLRN